MTVLYPIYPCIIIYDRYMGTYSKAKWTAWNMYYEDIPKEIYAGDIECMKFWDFSATDIIVGKGENPLEAYKDLIEKLHQGV